MTEYKDTLNLPNTAFPMKAGLAKREPEMLVTWQEKQIYAKLRQIRQGQKKFILHDGPPYANGHLHCGHALNKILKDFIVKAKSMSGYDAPFVPGWDCHGLPIELNVEKKIGKAGVKVTPAEFRKKCRAYAAQQITIQKSEFKRLGLFGDWDNPYASMDYKYEANIVRALAKIIDQGHMVQGFKPVNWCIDCGSSLAEAEVDYEDKTSQAIDVAFKVADTQLFFSKLNLNKEDDLAVIVPIWTTTPWTLPGNEAVCLNGELSYSLIKTKDYYILIASDLIAPCLKRYKIEKHVVIANAKGEEFELLKLQHPLYDTQVPIILGEHVTTETGTGCVHTAPAHGVEDYNVAAKYKLPFTNPVLGNGCYDEKVPLFAGLSILKANPEILTKLTENNTLLCLDEINHSYPHCWRHKSPTIFLATPQWFISMEKQGLRQQILNLIPEVKWIPEWGAARISKMISGRPDWCISRQRAWGTPIPLFLHKTSKKPHPNTTEFMLKIAERFAESGIEAWFALDINEFLGAEASEYEKSNDTLDVWFDSGVSHFCVLSKTGMNVGMPADIYLEGSDQHRGWFNSSLTTSVAINNAAPYKSVLTHGYTVDAEGRKLSKSRGNYVALDKLIAQYGADILRLWVSSSDYRNELSISDEILKRVADAYRRIRNTARFLLANLFDFDPIQNQVAGSDLLKLDSWIIQRCQELQAEVLQAYSEYNFHVIYQKIHHFCAIDLGSFYLDIIKDRQYTTPIDSRARRSCQTAMYHIVQSLTRMLAPILSFTADEIWQNIPGNKSESVFLETWYTDWPELLEVDMQFWQQLQTIRDEVNRALENARKDSIIGSALAAEITIYANSSVRKLLANLASEARFVFITSKVELADYTDRPTNIFTNPELEIAVAVTASPAEKCARCWHRLTSVGTNQQHPLLCERCVANISGQEEQRMFA